MPPLGRLGAATLALVALVALTVGAPVAAASEDLEDLALDQVPGFQLDEGRSGPLDTAKLIPLLPNRDDARALAESTKDAYVQVFRTTVVDAEPPAEAIVVLLFELRDGEDAEGFVAQFVEGARDNERYEAFAVPQIAQGAGARFRSLGAVVETVAVPRNPYVLAVAAVPGADARATAVNVAIVQAQRLDAVTDAAEPGDDATSDDDDDETVGAAGALAVALLAGAGACLLLTIWRRPA